jgi:nucleotide-binding universal stress UspA family protein
LVVPYRRILVPTDFSPASRTGVERAAALARATKAKVELLFVVEKAFFTPMAVAPQVPVSFGGEGDLLGETVEDGEKRLGELKAAHFAGVDCTTKVSIGASGASGILDQAKAFGADLIIMSSVGRGGVMRLLLGSTAEKVVRHAECEVLIVKVPDRPAEQT